MSVWSRTFVALVFLVLGASFITTTAVLIREFAQPEDWADPLAIGTTTWFSLASFYSHLFIFFPTFGILALWAFYTPAVCFVDMYWKHVPAGRFRFLAGFAVVVAFSWFASEILKSGDERSMFEIRPDVLAADTGAPAECNARAGECNRLPVLTGLSNLRQIAHLRSDLEEFSRNCQPDQLMPRPKSFEEERYCFVTGTLPARSTHFKDGSACCAAQQSFANWFKLQHKTVPNRSMTGEVHNLLLPFKVFFLLVLLIVGVLLALRRSAIEEHYPVYMNRIERGVLIGAVVMLFWPIMNHAFMHSAVVLYGNSGESIFRYLGPGFSIAFGAWGLLLLFFFFRRFGANIDMIGKVAGVVSAGVAVLQYEHLVDYMAWFAGSGASIYSIGVLLLLGVLAMIPLVKKIGGDAAVGVTEAVDVANTAVGGAVDAAGDAVEQMIGSDDTDGRYRSRSGTRDAASDPRVTKDPPIV